MTTADTSPVPAQPPTAAVEAVVETARTAIRDFPFWDYGMDVDPTSVDAEWVVPLAIAVIAAVTSDEGEASAAALIRARAADEIAANLRMCALLAESAGNDCRARAFETAAEIAESGDADDDAAAIRGLIGSDDG